MISVDDLGVLADDLSGACNVASCFVANCTSPVTVYVHIDLPRTDGAQLEVFNTQSRTLDAATCRQIANRAGRKLRNKPVVFKKIDAALRGCVGAELEGLLESIGEREVVVAPAIPRIGRTTSGGVQYDRGVPIDRTEYGDDPVSPVRSARVLDIIRKTGNLECRVCDAVSDEDLDTVVEGALRGSAVLLVGSLGLARALARRLPEAGGPPPWKGFPGAVWILCGSKYERARMQIETASERLGAPIVEVEPDATQTIREAGIERLREVIWRIAKPADVRRSRQPGDLVLSFVTWMKPLLESAKLSGIGVIGGDTAFELMMGCGVGLLEVAASIGEVVACGRIRDGSLAGATFALKGGSVGDEDVVVEMIEFLEGVRGGDA